MKNDPLAWCVIASYRVCIFPDALTHRVPKVPEAPRTPFWHFWHLISLGFRRNTDYILTVERRQLMAEPSRNDTRAQTTPVERFLYRAPDNDLAFFCLRTILLACTLSGKRRLPSHLVSERHLYYAYALLDNQVHIANVSQGLDPAINICTPAVPGE
jgi:hypothetical protein